MRRISALILTLMLAFASIASTVHAMPNENAYEHANKNVVHVVMSNADTQSCCHSETQRIAASCHVAVGILPAEPHALSRAACAVLFASNAAFGAGIHPETLLGPPRP